jgi:hypothetical protein
MRSFHRCSRDGHCRRAANASVSRRWWAWASTIISTHSASGAGLTPPRVVMTTSLSHSGLAATWSTPEVSSCTHRSAGAASGPGSTPLVYMTSAAASTGPGSSSPGPSTGWWWTTTRSSAERTRSTNDGGKSSVTATCSGAEGSRGRLI